MKGNILKHVEFLDKVRVHVFAGQPSAEDRFPIRIEFESLDPARKVVFDEGALRKMNEMLTEKAQTLDPREPRLKSYLEEYAGRLANELYRNGLVVMEALTNSPDDPYAAIRKQFSRN